MKTSKKRAPTRAIKVATKRPSAPAAYRIVPAESSVVFDCDARSHSSEPIFGAAYLMTDRAYARLSGDRAKTITVELRSKSPAGAKDLELLAGAFLRELETQRVRWAVSKNNQSVREFIVEQAILTANGRAQPAAPAASADPAGDPLTDSQRLEIERLIAEVEDEIKTMNQKKTSADPKNIKVSWEAKQEPPTESRS